MLAAMFRISDCLWRSVAARLLTLVGVCLLLCVLDASAVGEVVWAVNCGGDAHVDSYGIQYRRDYLNVGHASAHGRSLQIRRVPHQDQSLYQTERYHTANFAYDLPITADGDYVLVMKFSEVWFTQPNNKVFSVQLNKEHTIVDGLDIYASAGFSMAHDEIVPFTVDHGKLYVNKKESSAFSGTLHIEFVKHAGYDNPKINAMYVMRGKLEDAPHLPPLPTLDEFPDADESEEEDYEATPAGPRKPRRGAEPRVIDPYATEDSSSMLVPVAVAVGVFIPLVFCLCKL